MISFIFFPSSNISQLFTSQNLKSKLTIVDFHAPVFHTKATLFPGFILKSKFLIILTSLLYQVNKDKKLSVYK
ncbi:hypothetical protein ACFLY2_03350, partial [Patescibacteria group bacterium]